MVRVLIAISITGAVLASAACGSGGDPSASSSSAADQGSTTTTVSTAPNLYEEQRAAAVTVVLDGRSATGTIAQDDTLLDGAENFRPDLPFACKGGVCGTCRAKVLCGTVDMRRNYALEDDEVAAGFVLTCQTYPTSDDVTVDFDA